MPSNTAHPARFAGFRLIGLAPMAAPMLMPALATALLTLSACSDKEVEKFAPVCPSTAILRDGGDLHRYRGTGHDIIDTVLEGRITALNGSCVRDGTDTVVTTIAVSMELNHGPAAHDRTADIAYFVAVLDGDRILEKRVFSLKAEFPPNTDKLRLTGEQIDMRIPVTAKKTAAAYKITVGFQLTPAELELNRQRNGGR